MWVHFRYIAFVTGNDTDPAYVHGNGSVTSDFTMRFRVNGANIMGRGANYIPTEILDARINATALRQVRGNSRTPKIHSVQF